MQHHKMVIKTFTPSITWTWISSSKHGSEHAATADSRGVMPSSVSILGCKTITIHHIFITYKYIHTTEKAYKEVE